MKIVKVLNHTMQSVTLPYGTLLCEKEINLVFFNKFDRSPFRFSYWQVPLRNVLYCSAVMYPEVNDVA